VLALALFFGLNLLIYQLLDHMYFQSFGGNSGAQINHVLRQTSDIFIFGASRASHHYDPLTIEKATGMSVFNAGDDGKNAVYQLGLLKMLLKKHTPQAIIYEVGDVGYGLAGGTVDLYPYYHHDPEVRQLLRGNEDLASLKFLVPLYSYNRKIFNVSKGYLLKTKPRANGFRPIDGSMHPAEAKRISEGFNASITETPFPSADPYALDCFRDFAATCSDLGIALFFVYSPVYAPSELWFEHYVQRLAIEHQIRYISYAEDKVFNWSDSLFKDGGHLNRDGAILFTSDLMRRIHIGKRMASVK